MRKLLFTLSLLAMAGSLLAGGIKGYIRNTEGEPLEFATIYIDELGSGTVTNIEGYYEFRMLPGDYRVVFQHLGYETLIERVSIGEGMKELNIQLKSQTFSLDEVEIIDGGEDPAYTVMRKAIAKADFHRQQVDFYKAQVYIKGSGRLLKTPGIARKLLEREGVKADSSTAFTSESVSLIEYERPNTYREKVISIYSEGEDNGSSPNGYIYGSFYEPDIAQAVSPLSPRAFGYYKFELAGYFNDRGYNVNKIKVIPRSRGDNVFAGYIYIVEDLWSIHSLELGVYKLGIEFDIEQIYAPIKEDVWLPVSHRFIVSGKLFGFGFDYRYLATVSDYEIRINPDLDVDFAVIDEKIDRELARTAEARQRENKSLAEIDEKLNTGEELTRKDLRRMMREYEKEELQEEEEPEVVENVTYEVDSLATRRDSTYWAAIRPIPLTTAEVRGYEVLDSMAVADREIAEAEAEGVKNPGRKRNSRYSIFDLISGNNVKLGDGKRLHYDGLHNAGFNPVEGFWLATRFRYTQKGDKNNFEWSVLPRYGFSWDRAVWRSDAKYNFGVEHSRNRLMLHGGRYIAQYNEPRPVSELFNTFYALMGERNFVRLYEKRFVGASWNKRWRSTARLYMNVEWADRATLFNTTDQTWFPSDSREYAPNLPDIIEAPTIPVANEKAATFDLSFRVKPWQKYRIRNGERSAVDASSPEFRLNYRQGIPDINESVTDYQRVGIVYRHTIRPGARGKIDLKVDMGMFLNNDNVGLADYQHFNGNQMIFTTADPVGAFRLLPYYTFSTRDKWVAAHAHYQFRKFLLTQIWEVQMTGARENLFVNYLNSPESEHYTEVGYSLDNILRFLRVEAAVAFRDGQYFDWGIRIGVASNIFGSFGAVEIDED
ncbi:MAG: DUF5686 and carboxypeptidase regulatory-like domain-containing protein [Bacteroidota bacterium]